MFHTSVELLLTPEKVLKAERRATKQALMKAGAFVRTNARRTQLRRRKRASRPGMPPSVHSRHKFASLRNIRFQLNAKQTEVVVGPLKYTSRSSSKPINTTVPGVLEHGGAVVVRKRNKRAKVIHIAKRPFMKKAFDEEMPKFPALWKDRIK